MYVCVFVLMSFTPLGCIMQINIYNWFVYFPPFQSVQIYLNKLALCNKYIYYLLNWQMLLYKAIFKVHIDHDGTKRPT